MFRRQLYRWTTVVRALLAKRRGSVNRTREGLSNPRLQRPRRRRDSDLSPRNATSNYGGLGDDAAVLRRRFHRAAALWSQRSAVHRNRRDGRTTALEFA